MQKGSGFSSVLWLDSNGTSLKRVTLEWKAKSGLPRLSRGKVENLLNRLIPSMGVDSPLGKVLDQGFRVLTEAQKYYDDVASEDPAAELECKKQIDKMLEELAIKDSEEVQIPSSIELRMLQLMSQRTHLFGALKQAMNQYSLAALELEIKQNRLYQSPYCADLKTVRAKDKYIACRLEDEILKMRIAYKYLKEIEVLYNKYSDDLSNLRTVVKHMDLRAGLNNNPDSYTDDAPDDEPDDDDTNDIEVEETTEA